MFDKHRSSIIDIFICLATVGAVVFVDRITKIAFTRILHIGESLPVISKFFYFTLVHNTGIAFGLFRDNGFVFLIVPVIAMFLLGYNIYYYHKFGDLDRVYIVAFSMILGGAIGNLIDRISYGYVIDFIDFRVWPVFNLSDSAITIGAVIILFKCFPLTGKKKTDKTPVRLRD